MVADMKSYLYGCAGGFFVGVMVTIILSIVTSHEPAAYRILPEGGICTLERGTLFDRPAVSWRRDDVLVREGLTFLGGEPELANARPLGDILAKCLEAPDEKWTWVVAKPKQK